MSVEKEMRFVASAMTYKTTDMTFECPELCQLLGFLKYGRERCDEEDFEGVFYIENTTENIILKLYEKSEEEGKRGREIATLRTGDLLSYGYEELTPEIEELIDDSEADVQNDGEGYVISDSFVRIELSEKG